MEDNAFSDVSLLLRGKETGIGRIRGTRLINMKKRPHAAKTVLYEVAILDIFGISCNLFGFLPRMI